MYNKDIKKSIRKIKKVSPRILVIGDMMLDHYIFGKVTRISPEAPVPILNFEKETRTLGGAGNVMYNLSNLGVKVTIGSITGYDESGIFIEDIIKKIKNASSLILKSKNFKTTKKTRFISKGIQLLRLDDDSKGHYSKHLDILKKNIIEYIETSDCILISDYNKGICSESFIRGIIKLGVECKTPVYVDPKGFNWEKYKNSNCITPNKKEVEEELKLKLSCDDDFEKAARILMQKYKLGACLITRGSNGMTYVNSESVIHQKVNRKEVFDVSGAGDTVIACFAAALSTGFGIKDTLSLSSALSSEVVTHLGTVPFSIGMIED